MHCEQSKTSQVTYVTMVPRVGNETLRPLGIAMGNAFSVTRVWRYICKNTTCWPATAHDVTTGTTTIEYIIRFFVWSLRPKHGSKPRGCVLVCLVPHSGNHGYIRNLRRSPSWELRTVPLGVAMGNAIPTQPCWGECKPLTLSPTARQPELHTLRSLPSGCRNYRTQGRAQRSGIRRIPLRAYGQAPSGSN